MYILTNKSQWILSKVMGQAVVTPMSTVILVTDKYLTEEVILVSQARGKRTAGHLRQVFFMDTAEMLAIRYDHMISNENKSC